MSPPDPAPPSSAIAIGEALRSRADTVVARIRELSVELPRSPYALFESEYGAATRSATIAVGTWLADGGSEEGAEAGRSVSRLFGRLAAHHEVSLTEMTRRCLRWRDAMLEVASDEGRRLDAPATELERVAASLHRSCDATLVRLCEAFEDELHNVQHELSARQEQMRYQTTHDALTGLPNRAVVLERAELALHRGRRNRRFVAAVFIDLDNFRNVNDTLGHRAGDELLASVTERLRLIVPESAVLGRLGGDEFVVLLEDLVALDEVDTLVERLLETLREPFALPGHRERPLTLTASIGVACDSQGSADELLRNADVAMYRAKWEGKNRQVKFEPEMQWAARSRLELDMELQRAHEHGEYFLVYQPTFDLRTLRVTGVEALLRWHHPSRGEVLPGEFVPQLERSGLVNAVGQWVLGAACAQGATWRAEGHEVPISVNVSARQLDDPAFVDTVHDALLSSGFPAGLLTIEITETAIVKDTERSALRLAGARELGVRVAVDDFGTGYSSLAHLQFFPVDALKIDRSFVASMLRGRESEALVHTLVQLGDALGIETLAEGIEDLAQLAHLRDEQCTSGQGFLFAEPLRAEEIGTFFSNWAGGVHALGPS